MNGPILTALPNVSTACLTLPPGPPYCTCPVYGPGGEWMPYNHGAWVCRLVLAEPAPQAVVVPTLSEWAFLALVTILAVLGAWRIRR